eukprot:GSMAST32.ASY1.ANO1.2543.1 assembled CDS
MSSTDETTYVKIKSAEGHEFIVSREAALVSGTMKAMLSGDFAESRGEMSFPEISTDVMEKVIRYLYHKHKYSNSTSTVPEFEVKPQDALELLMASNYLDC